MTEEAKRGRGRPAKNAQPPAAAAVEQTSEIANTAPEQLEAPAAAAPEVMEVVLLRKYVPTGYFVNGNWMENVYDRDVGGMEACPKGTILTLKKSEAARAINKGIATMPLPDFADE